MSELKYIPVTDLHPHPDNPRKDVGDVSELADSLKTAGVLQNLTVVPGYRLSAEEWREVMAQFQKHPTEELRNLSNTRKSQEGYTVLIGHRRLAAAKLAGLEVLPCAVVSMTPQEQIATMLAENMQRTDLTVYEQAQGIQMMLDLGETVETVAQKTGLSQTTVRNRRKLLDLDQAAFEKSVERGGTLQDYMELESLSDPALKNEVLQFVGTANFRQQLLAAQKRETDKAYLAEVTAALEAFAVRAAAYDSETMTYQMAYDAYSKKSVVRPADAGTAKYYFLASGRQIVLYRQKETAEPDDGGESAREQQNTAAKLRFEALMDLTAQAYQLRTAFIANFSVTKAQRNLSKIIALASKVMLPFVSELDPDVDLNLLGRLLEVQTNAEDNWIDQAAYRAAIQACPAYALLCTAYAALDCPALTYAAKEWNYATQLWEVSYCASDTLDTLYEFLEALGYEMSDAEKQLQNAEHPLFEGET